jgi:hypothetical protein
LNDEPTRWLANLVTHFRHEHSDWDRVHPVVAGKMAYFLKTDEEKAEVSRTYRERKCESNEAAKREIIEKAGEFLIAQGIGPDCFARLRNTEPKTISKMLLLMANSIIKTSKTAERSNMPKRSPPTNLL